MGSYGVRRPRKNGSTSPVVETTTAKKKKPESRTPKTSTKEEVAVKPVEAKVTAPKKKTAPRAKKKTTPAKDQPPAE